MRQGASSWVQMMGMCTKYSMQRLTAGGSGGAARCGDQQQQQVLAVAANHIRTAISADACQLASCWVCLCSPGNVACGACPIETHVTSPAHPCTFLQARVTGGIQQLLPGFLVPLFGQPIALDKLVVDDERHILYSLASNSAVQVCCLSSSIASTLADVWCLL